MSGARRSDHYEEEEFYVGEGSQFSQKLGGNMSDQLESARLASVVAAHRRIAAASANNSASSEGHEEPDPDDSGLHIREEPTQMIIEVIEQMNTDCSNEVDSKPYQEPDPDDHGYQKMFEPDPDDLEASLKHFVVAEPEIQSEEMKILDSKIQVQNDISEPDPDGLEAKGGDLAHGNIMRPDDANSLISETISDQSNLNKDYIKAESGESQEDGIMRLEPDPDDNLVHPVEVSRMQIDEPDPDEELQRIQDPVAVLCGRLQKAIEVLRAEVDAAQATVVLQTLFKIIR